MIKMHFSLPIKTLEPNPMLEPKLDLSQLYESVLVSIPSTFESKSTIPQNHIPLLPQGIDHYDSMIIFQDWSYNWDKFHARILYGPIHIRNCKNVKEIIKGGFRKSPHYLDRAAMLGPIRPSPKPPLWDNISFPYFFLLHLCIHS